MANTVGVASLKTMPEGEPLVLRFVGFTVGGAAIQIDVSEAGMGRSA